MTPEPPDPTAAFAGSVLVVDDTIENLRLLSDLLGEHGYEVRAVTTGRQALQAAEQAPPDLILLDISMPEMDGYEVCRRLKAAERSRDVPVIFLTASADTADMVLAFDAGGVDYVTKPFQFEEVLARVKAHVALKRAQSELAASYARLRDLEQLRDDLVSMVVHDMRSPLQSMLISLRMLEDSTSARLDGDDRACLESALEGTRSLSRKANDLFDVSRLEACRMPVDRAIWDLTGMAHDVRSELGSLDAARPIEIDSEGAVEVSCDGGLVRRVIENLVGNGIRHTPAGSGLRIAITRGDGRVRVAVQDEGPGVPAEARERIFQKFGTLHATYHSTGLGLTFCKLAVEAHGGTIGVDPGVEVGSTFWFELPA
jgi:signal transduction histidine kinase